MTEQEQRARTLLKERSALFQNSDDIDYVAAYMSQFAEAEIKREMREVVKGLRESVISRSDIQIPAFAEEICRYLESKYQI